MLGGNSVKIGIAGFGAIGKVVATAVDKNIKGMELVGVSVRNKEKAVAAMNCLSQTVPILSSKELANAADVIVECVPKPAFINYAVPALEAGKLFITVSGAGILANPHIISIAKENGGKIILATGALLGLDAVRAAAEGSVSEIRMITRKPPNALEGAKYLIENAISVENLSEPKKVFEGNALNGATGFPANVNVAAALGLAGIGAEKTLLEIWADPSLKRNTHTIKVDADSARFEMTIENVQSEENPGTGKITALSVVACLRSLIDPMRVGT